MNTVNLIGRVTHDLEITVTKNNKHALDFQVAVYESKDKTNFIRCQAWNQTADYLSQYALKGSQIGISGTLRVDKYTDREGANREKTYVMVNRAEVLDHRKNDLERANKEFGTVPESTSNVVIEESELPFY